MVIRTGTGLSDGAGSLDMEAEENKIYGKIACSTRKMDPGVDMDICEARLPSSYLSLQNPASNAVCPLSSSSLTETVDTTGRLP